MDTVSTRPKFGSVEYYADMIRRHAKTMDEVRVVTIAMADLAANAAVGEASADEMLGRVRNALAAGELVHAEMRQRA